MAKATPSPDTLRRRIVAGLHFWIDLRRASIHEGVFVDFDGADGRRRQRAPDVFVVHGLPMRGVESYVVRQEGRPPDFALEIASSISRTGVDAAPEDYAAMGVKEFVLFASGERFAPGEHVEPRLRGGRLNAQGGYDGLSVEELPDGHVGIYSEVLNLYVCHAQPWREDHELRLYNPGAQAFLDVEMEERLEAAEDEAKAQRELAARHAQAWQTADDQARARDEIRAARDEARAARDRADAAEAQIQAVKAEVEELKAQIRALRSASESS